MPKETITGNCSREYLESTIRKAESAIAFASPNADMSYAKAVLTFAQNKLSKLKES